MTDPHARFGAWLLAGAEGGPSRDLAVHASVCPGCLGAMAAFDQLTAIDPGAARIPAPTRAVARAERRGAFRAFAATAGVMLAATVLGVGGWQLVNAARGGRGDSLALASTTPNQDVLAASGTPEPTPQPVESAAASSDAPSAPPEGGAAATPLPHAAPRPTPTPQPSSTPTPGPTPPPTATLGPTPSPIPTATFGATPSPTPTATLGATPSPTPTPTPTPVPTAPDAPFLTASTGTNPGEIYLSWTTPYDGGDAITRYDVYSDAVLVDSVTAPITTYTHSGLTSGQEYFYYLVAVNSIGSSSQSNTTSAAAS